jgi:hypothetical protein
MPFRLDEYWCGLLQEKERTFWNPLRTIELTISLSVVDARRWRYFAILPVT